MTAGSWTMPTNSTGSSSVSSVDRDTGAVKAPEGTLAIVFTDVTRAASLWEFNSEAMLRAMILHNEVLRALLIKHHGYEVRFSGKDNAGGNGDGSFCVAFADPLRALEWCMDVQKALLTVEWPEALLAHPGAAEEWGDVDDRPIFKGLRVRMGLNYGEPRRLRDVVTRRVEYHGSVVNIAAHLTTITHGGQVQSRSAVQRLECAECVVSCPLLTRRGHDVQVLFTREVYEKVKDSELMQEQRRCTKLGRFEVNSSPSGTCSAP
jgi:class 3 adenylate cyclase